MANSISGSSVNDAIQASMEAASQEAKVYGDEIKQFVLGEISVEGLVIDPPWVEPTTNVSNVRAVANATDVSDFTYLSGGVMPEAPNLPSISIPDFGNIPELVLSEPVLSLPSSPDATLPASPGAAPAFNAPVIPADPVITLPDVPTFANVVMPTLPAYSIPTYSPDTVVDDLGTLTATFNYTEVDYTSILLDAVKAKLLNDVLNGGYGIETQDELGLWQRAAERELIAAETAIQDATRQAAARGFMMPPGALNALIEKAQQEALMKSSSLQRDIAIKRADMYVENRKFTLTEAREVENMLITYHGYRMERALNVAKYQAEFGIQIFNALVHRYNARLEAMKVAAQVYKTQLEAALAHLEAYKIEVEGVRLSVEVQKLYADVYRSQLEGVQAYVNVYRTRMEAAQIQAEVEKLKLDAFRSTVDAYTAQVGAKNAEFQMYEAQLRGEMTKVDVYKAGVDAYGAKVDAYQGVVQAKKTQVDAQVSSAQLQLDKYRAQLQAYGEQLHSVQVTNEALLTRYKGQLERYQTRVNSEVHAMNSMTEAMKANATVAVSKAQVASNHITHTAQVLERHNIAQADVAGHAMNFYTQKMLALGGQNSSIVAEISTGA